MMEPLEFIGTLVVLGILEACSAFIYIFFIRWSEYAEKATEEDYKREIEEWQRVLNIIDKNYRKI